MNDIIKDIMSENFTWREFWKYGVFAPALFILLVVIASAFDCL